MPSRLNPITQKNEPYVPAGDKVVRVTVTAAIVVFMLVCVIAAVFSVILFRLVLITFMYESTRSTPFFKTYARLIATGFAASVNASVIEVSGWFFQIIARKITNWEHPRTQADFENSYTFKMFLFQFINYYSSLIYTAFFKVGCTRELNVERAFGAVFPSSRGASSSTPGTRTAGRG